MNTQMTNQDINRQKKVHENQQSENTPLDKSKLHWTASLLWCS